MLIKYEFLKGQTAEVEVAEEIGTVILQIEDDTYNRDRAETRRHESLCDWNDKDRRAVDTSVDVVAAVVGAIEREELHGWPLDPIITHTDMNERTECEKHIQFLRSQLPHIARNSIITIDRGYPSLDLFERMQTSGLYFVARCSSRSMQEINDAPLGESRVILKNGISVRVVKFTLPNGDVETLATNLFELPAETIIELYAMRWGIELAYFKLKRELSVEKFSGKTPNAIRQDFWASMVLMQAVAVFQQDADRAIQERQDGKSVKHLKPHSFSGAFIEKAGE